MAIPGRLHGTMMGPYIFLNRFAGASPVTYAMPTQNNAHCVRFMATQAKDIKSVKVNWSTVTNAGTVELRIETIDATTRKPTGTLYDAAATKSFTPVAGWQTVTFDVLPTTNLTAGTEYGVVLITTATGTAHTLRTHVLSDAQSAVFPMITLTASDGTTRSNFAEVTSSNPIGSFILDDDTEDPMGMIPYAVQPTDVGVYGTNAFALKLTVDGTITAYGVQAHIVKTGTPAGDLRVRILNTGGTALSNSTVSVVKESLAGLTADRNCQFMFPGLVTLASGTYYIVFDSASSANSANCWSMNSVTPADTTVAPSGFIVSTTADITAGPPPTWTDNATGDQPIVRLMIDDITAPAGGGSANLLAGKL